MTWSPDKIEEARRLRERGYSFSKIARRFGCTKNAVIGLAHREGFPKIEPSGECAQRSMEEAAFAEELKDRICSYWKDRGHRVAVQVSDTGFSREERCRTHIIRSDMVNGLPKTWEERA